MTTYSRFRDHSAPSYVPLQSVAHIHGDPCHSPGLVAQTRLPERPIFGLPPPPVLLSVYHVYPLLRDGVTVDLFECDLAKVNVDLGVIGV